MFEKATPPAIPSARRINAREVSDLEHYIAQEHDGAECGEAIPLRKIEWNELTARLNAARDLRQLLREDVNGKSRGGDFNFADAAERFFRATEEDQRPVNHKGLEPRKTSSGIAAQVSEIPDQEIPNTSLTPLGQSVSGDTREKR